MTASDSASTVSPDSGLFAEYRGPHGVFDEMQAAPGVVREHWQKLVEGIERLGKEGLRERRHNARQLLKEHGVTYNVHADGQSAERTWELDMLPLVIDAGEWAEIETGLIQRSRLLNLLLKDIYGPQRLFREGVLPPALLHANPGFLRACHGIRPPQDIHLSLHAVDLMRAPNGRWWVLSDRTQAPSGVGYALENRIILSRILGEEFRECGAQRLASFFVARKAGLRWLAAWADSPHVVLLTPGPYAETYFEHAYLARYMGYPLVEGSDLTVRDRRVFMKTLQGLQPVDVIVRRVDDTYCDPLELRGDSILGVPGLVEAARAGRVVISNALGSGAVEAPALLAFLPALAKRLLGEDLLIPNVATWWCGQESERNYALWALESLVIKRAFVGGEGEPGFGESMDAAERERIAARVQASPHAFVGQERVPVSTAPVWNGEKLEPRPLIIRCYVCATPGGYAVMPGGLTRVSASANSPVVSSRYGGGSKDTWVLASGPVDAVTLLDSTGQPTRLEYAAVAAPSRAVENLFWLGRYVERLEDTTRLIRTVLSRLTGEGGHAEEAELAALCRWLSHIEVLPRNAARYSDDELIAAVRDVVFSRNAGSICALIARAGFLTASVRDRLSGDTWRILNQLTTEFPNVPPQAPTAVIVSMLHRLISCLAAFSGMEMENMTRGDTWRFLDIGRRLERSNNLLASLRAALTTTPESGHALAPLLEYTDSTMTYRRIYLSSPELPAVLQLLFSDESNPRSLAFQFRALGHHLSELPGGVGERVERARFAELSMIAANASGLLESGAGSSGRQQLQTLLKQLKDGCWDLSDLLSASYFSHVPARVS
jgi:uncharacterized circularly permuted ATP-grasp superfamily protein/uncharacterized alpha-E superfamily protein